MKFLFQHNSAYLLYKGDASFKLFSFHSNSQEKLKSRQVANRRENSEEFSAKMQVLQFCTRFWKFLGLFTSASHIDPDTNDFLKTIQSWIVLFNSSVLMVIASTNFVVRNLMNFDEVTVEMEVLVAGIQAIGVYLPVGLKMFDAKRMILEIQALSDRGKWFFSELRNILFKP